MNHSMISATSCRFRNGTGMVIVATLCSLTACQQATDATNSLQVGQIIGGGTVEMTDLRPVAGFLPQPQLLQRGSPGETALTYRNPVVNMASYHMVMLDPVTLWTAPGSPLDSVPANQKQAAANVFYSDLRDALQKHCQLVAAPAPGTLRMRFAVVDATLPNAVVNTVATYAPYASGLYGAASLAFNKGVGYFAGTATAEGYVVDATNGTLIWQGVDRRGGTTAAIENTLNTWLDVHHAFEAWSNQLVLRLQTMGVCTT
jgi:hypothetical protein